NMVHSKVTTILSGGGKSGESGHGRIVPQFRDDGRQLRSRSETTWPVHKEVQGILFSEMMAQHGIHLKSHRQTPNVGKIHSWDSCSRRNYLRHRSGWFLVPAACNFY